MRHGVVASIASKKRRLEVMNKSKKYMEADEESQQSEQDNIQLLKKKVFTISFYPFLPWFFGLTVTILGVYFFSVIAAQNTNANIKGFDEGIFLIIYGKITNFNKKINLKLLFFNQMQKNRYWWQYFICVCVVLFGVCIILIQKMQKIRIDKEKGLITIRKRSILCVQYELQKPINTFSDLYIVKMGYQTKFSKVIHYTLSMSFSDQRERVTLLSYTSLDKAKRNIRKFLGLLTDEKNVGVVDESSQM